MTQRWLLAPITASLVLFSGCSGLERAEKLRSEPSLAGRPPVVRLMSEMEYKNGLQNIFGAGVVPPARFAPFRRTDGLAALGSKSAGTTTGGVEIFEGVARIVASKVVDVSHRDFLVSCLPAAADKSDDKCASTFIEHYGRLLLRRPLAKNELADYVAIARNGAKSSSDFYFGLSSSLSALLVSPEFLFFIETTEPDPVNRGKVRLTAQSMASRLSLLLWNAPPDKALLDAADRGEMHDRKGLHRQVDRMLASPRLEQGMRAFFDDMLVFEDFDSLAKDTIIYPAFSPKAVGAAREQTLRTLIDQLIARNGDYREIFTTDRTFIDGDLSQLYKLPVTHPKQWEAYDLSPETGRAGVLTEISFLALHSHPGRSSPTRRGKALREIFLCQKIPDPPPNVDFSGFQDPKNSARTTRERLAIHAVNPVCAGCHRLTDPIGIALENFDSAGQFRAMENGTQIDTSTSWNGNEIKNAADLGKALYNDPAATHCLVNRLYSYGLGYKPSPQSAAWLEELHRRFAAHGYRLIDLLRDIATSQAFYAVSDAPSVSVAASGAEIHAVANN